MIDNGADRIGVTDADIEGVLDGVLELLQAARFQQPQYANELARPRPPGAASPVVGLMVSTRLVSRIVNLASISVVMGCYGRVNYAASKAGVVAMMKV